MVMEVRDAARDYQADEMAARCSQIVEPIFPTFDMTTDIYKDIVISLCLLQNHFLFQDNFIRLS